MYVSGYGLIINLFKPLGKKKEIKSSGTQIHMFILQKYSEPFLCA